MKQLPSYEFISRHYGTGYSHQLLVGESRIRILSQGCDLGEILSSFECFLRGAGFSFKGSVQIVEEPDAAND